MKKTLVIGSGSIGIEYYNILKYLDYDTKLLSRSNAADLTDIAEPNDIIVGDILNHNIDSINKFDFFIIAVQPRFSLNILLFLLKNTSSSILIEKPVGLSSLDFSNIDRTEFNSRVYVALNRRWFNSLKTLKNELKNKKIFTVNIEFTEHLSRMRGPSLEIEKWAILNSIHILDMGLCFFGIPKIKFIRNLKHNELKLIEAVGELDHINFNFKAYWGGPGNWNFSVITDKAKYELNPIETLKKQSLESFNNDEIFLEKPKTKFKIGFYEQTKNFIDGNRKEFVDYDYYLNLIKLIEKIMQYDK